MASPAGGLTSEEEHVGGGGYVDAPLADLRAVRSEEESSSDEEDASLDGSDGSAQEARRKLKHYRVSRRTPPVWYHTAFPFSFSWPNGRRHTDNCVCVSMGGTPMQWQRLRQRQMRQLSEGRSRELVYGVRHGLQELNARRAADTVCSYWLITHSIDLAASRRLTHGHS